MSTYLYGALTERRLAAPSLESADPTKNGISTATDVLAALVPAELLAAHAAILSWGSSQREVPVPGGGSEMQTVIDDPLALRIFFAGIVLASVAIYLFGLGGKPVGVGWIRMLIPGAAFVLWTMIQKNTMFDAVAPHLAMIYRFGIPVLVAAALGAGSKRLGSVADRAENAKQRDARLAADKAAADEAAADEAAADKAAATTTSPPATAPPATAPPPPITPAPTL